VLTSEVVEQRGACRVIADEHHRVRRPHTGAIDLVERSERVLHGRCRIGEAPDRRLASSIIAGPIMDRAYTG